MTEKRTVEIVVSGRPRPKGSWKPITVRGVTRLIPDNKRSRPWQDSVANSARVAFGCGRPHPGAVYMNVAFLLERPASHYAKDGTVRNSAPPYPSRHRADPDVDKLVRGVMDALTGIVYADDSQVISVTASKQFCGESRAIIRCVLVSEQEETTT